MITNLLRTEVRRFWLRRATRATFVLVLLAATAIMVLASWNSTKPITDAERAEAAAIAQQQNAQFPADQRADCLKERAAEQAKHSEARYDCGDATADTFLRTRDTRASLLGHVPDVALELGTLGILVAVASFIGAEFSSGSLGNQLTFDPRRGPTFWAKLLAAAMGAMAFAAVLSALLLGAVWLVSGLHHAEAGHLDGGAGHWAWVMVRGVLSMGLLALGIAALAILVRHTAAVIGVAFAYMIGVQILAGSFPRSQAVSLFTNLGAFVHGRSSYQTMACATGPGGYSCDPVDHAVSMWHGLTVIGVAALAICLVAQLVFARRDVN